MSDNVIAARAPLKLLAPPLDLLDVFARRKVRVVLIYAAYLAAVTTAAIWSATLPPKYEVTAMIDLQPPAYSMGDGQRLHLSRADEMARSEISIFTTDPVIRGALADAGPPPKPKPAPKAAPERRTPPPETPVATRAAPAPIRHQAAAARLDGAPERLAVLPALEIPRPVIDQVKSVALRSYDFSVLAIGLATKAALSVMDDLGAATLSAKDAILPPLPTAGETYLRAKESLKATAEPNTGFIRISYQARDPDYAVKFLNALIQRFTEKHYDLYSNGAAVSFFARHRKESEEEFSLASAELAAFSASHNIFNIDEQRKLLLQERSRVASDLASTRDLRAQNESEASAIADQLVQMKPFSRYPQINSLAETTRRLHPRSHDATTADEKNPAPQLPNLTGDPPLLLVKVYQDTIATLVKLNTDIAGLRTKLKYQQSELDDINRKLADLSAKESAFERLRQRVDLARTTTSQFAKKAIDEQIQQDLNAQKLSTVRIVQPPTPPVEPVWPRRLIVAIALVLAALPPIALAGPAAYRRYGTA